MSLTLLFFDTETNGLPKDRRAIPQQTDLWPHILQIAWKQVEVSDTGDVTTKSEYSAIINPGDIPWNNESAAIHGITRERTRAEGIPILQALTHFKAICMQSHVLIAHNLEFDKSVLRAEYYRQSSSESLDWWPSYEYCTMQSTKQLCKLPFANGRPGRANDPYKLPKLLELHTYLFGNTGDYEFHNAYADVHCTYVCFQELLRRRLVLPFDQWVRAFRVRLGVDRT
jgi:DNA polymerase III epsilon subunit-like protein